MHKSEIAPIGYVAMMLVPGDAVRWLILLMCETPWRSAEGGCEPGPRVTRGRLRSVPGW